MTHSGGKHLKVGDLGQRYEIWCKDGSGKDMQIGWSESPVGFKSMVDNHPAWHSHRSVDRRPPHPEQAS